MKTALVCASLSVALLALAPTPAHADCSASVSKNISIKAPAAFTGTLEDDTYNPMAAKNIELTSRDKNASISQAMVTDSHGTFHFDSVPAGKYAITIDFSGWAVKKAEIHFAADKSCHVALVVRPVSPHDCYHANYSDIQDGGGSVIRH